MPHRIYKSLSLSAAQSLLRFHSVLLNQFNFCSSLVQKHPHACISIQVWAPDPQLQIVLWWEALCWGEEVWVGPWPCDRCPHHTLHWDQGSGVYCQNDHKPHLWASRLHLATQGQDGSQAEPRLHRATQSYLPERRKGTFHYQENNRTLNEVVDITRIIKRSFSPAC